MQKSPCQVYTDDLKIRHPIRPEAEQSVLQTDCDTLGFRWTGSILSAYGCPDESGVVCSLLGTQTFVAEV